MRKTTQKQNINAQIKLEKIAFSVDKLINKIEAIVPSIRGTEALNNISYEIKGEAESLQTVSSNLLYIINELQGEEEGGEQWQD